MNNNLTILTALEKIVKDNTDFKAVKSGYGKEFADYYTVSPVAKEEIIIILNPIVADNIYENSEVMTSSSANIYIITQNNYEIITFEFIELFKQKLIETYYGKTFDISFVSSVPNYDFNFQLIEFNIIIKER